MVSVAERAPPLFSSTPNATEPFPLPLLPEVTVTHPAPLLAVQEQPLPADTATVPLPPDAALEKLVELIEYAHETGAAACVTLNVWPAMVMVPERAPPALAATLYVTGPFPLPLAPEVTVTHPALLLAVQAHPVPADTATVPVPPDAAIVAFNGPT